VGRGRHVWFEPPVQFDPDPFTIEVEICSVVDPPHPRYELGCDVHAGVLVKVVVSGIEEGELDGVEVGDGVAVGSVELAGEM
jgi:hypothetical protein